MHNAPYVRSLSLVLATLLLAATTLGTSAVFAADEPDSDLDPLGNADKRVEIHQGTNTILWASLSGAVSSYTVLGWPSTEGDSELGGALMIEKPDDALAGIIDFGEKPMTLSFEIDR